MRELRPGLWHRRAPHPGWTPDEHWDQSVSSHALDDGDRLLLFDPLAADREPAGRFYATGDRLPFGVEAFPGRTGAT